MAIDLLGGVFLDLLLVFKKDLGAIAAFTYSIVVVGDCIQVYKRAKLIPYVLDPGCNRRTKTNQLIHADAPSTKTSGVGTPSSVVGKPTKEGQHIKNRFTRFLKAYFCGDNSKLYMTHMRAIWIIR